MDLLGAKTEFVKNYVRRILKSDNSEFKSKAEIARALDIKPQYLNSLLNGERNISDKFFKKFTAIFNITQKDLDEIKMIDTLLMAEHDAENYLKGIPLITFEAVAGFGNDVFSISQQDIQAYYQVPDFNSIDFMVRVKGNSMYPKYSSGDIIACKILHERNFIQWNKPHLVATREQGIIVKRLRRSEKEGFLKAVSDNKDYDPFEIPESDITGVAIIIGVIRLE